MIVNSRGNPRHGSGQPPLTLALRFESYNPGDATASHRLALKFFTRSARWLLARRVPSRSSLGDVWRQPRRNQPGPSLACPRRNVHLGRYGRSLVAGLRQPAHGRGHMRRITVTRSPFVYKKTREQFGLRSVRLTSQLGVGRATMNHMVPTVCRLRLPGESTLISR